MNNASTKTRPTALNPDAIAQLATCLHGDARADGILGRTCDRPLGGGRTSSLSRNHGRRCVGHPASFKRIASEVRHGER